MIITITIKCTISMCFVSKIASVLQTRIIVASLDVIRKSPAIMRLPITGSDILIHMLAEAFKT